MKAVRKDAAFVLLCPSLSARSQTLCLEKGIDFIDLAGNLSISVPGKLLIQRTGQKVPEKITASFYRNPFSGKSSRILRVLLQRPGRWTLSDILQELESETNRNPWAGPTCRTSISEVSEPSKSRPLVEFRPKCFEVSAGFASRVLRSLEEELLVVRQNSAVTLPEPRRLLTRWAEEYKKRVRWDLRKSLTLPNPFGTDLASVTRGLDTLFNADWPNGPNRYAFRAAAAASITAPFVDIDLIDLFVSNERAAELLRTSISGPGLGPELRVIYPYDIGVFMYGAVREGVPGVSDIQAYLDLFARGGRDLKQADYLFEKRIAPSWASK
ncbi:MAG: hypothetical protein KGM47_01830 [Acidobacteriota bacterium]|nr:hypothetical protein [Acidobacteriota bacterium]